MKRVSAMVPSALGSSSMTVCSGMSMEGTLWGGEKEEGVGGEEGVEVGVGELVRTACTDARACVLRRDAGWLRLLPRPCMMPCCTSRHPSTSQPAACYIPWAIPAHPAHLTHTHTHTSSGWFMK